MFSTSKLNGDWKLMGSNIVFTPPPSSSFHHHHNNNKKEVGTSDDWYFGLSVSISSNGQTVAIGSPNTHYNPGFVRVYMYHSNKKKWMILGKNKYDGTLFLGQNGDKFGSHVALSSDGLTLAISSPVYTPSTGDVNDNDNKYRKTGAVIVYTRSSISEDDLHSPWIQKGRLLHGHQSGDAFGSSIALSGDGLTLAIASWHGAYVSVYTYGESNDNDDDNEDGRKDWYEIGHDLKELMTSRANGLLVALNANGSILAIGAPSAVEDDGHVTTYIRDINNKNNNGGWKQHGNSIRGLREWDNHGSNIDLSDDGQTLVIGKNCGNYVCAYIYDTKNDDNNWIHRGTTKQALNRYGIPSRVSISANGNVVAERNGMDQVRVFARNNNNNNENDEYHDNENENHENENENHDWHVVGNGMLVEEKDIMSIAISGEGTIVAVGCFEADHVSVYTLAH